MQAETPNWVTDLICEFLEAVTHEILFLRRIYDRDIFARQRLYDIAVHKARHPDLSEFISTTLLSLKVRIRCYLKLMMRKGLLYTHKPL